MRVERVGILLVLALGCTGGGEGLDLRLNLEAGQSYGLKMVMDEKIEENVQGRTRSTTRQMGVGYTFAVESVDAEGNAWIKSTYKWVSMKQELPMNMGTVEYDSSSPPEEIPLMARGSAALLGHSIDMRLAPKGTVLEVKGLDVLLRKMLDEIEIPRGIPSEEVEGQLREQFGDDALKGMMRNVVAHYPEKPVKVGDSWDQTVVIRQGFPMIIETTYTLRERKGGVATIDNRSTIRSNPDAAPLRYKLAGTQQGYMRVDEATGMTLSSEVTQTFDVTLVTEGSGKGEDPGNPVSVSNIVTIGPLEK